jgi:hypothetical protein
LGGFGIQGLCCWRDRWFVLFDDHNVTARHWAVIDLKTVSVMENKFFFDIPGYNVLITSYLVRKLSVKAHCKLICCVPMPKGVDGVTCGVEWDKRFQADEIASITYLCGIIVGELLASKQHPIPPEPIAHE